MNVSEYRNIFKQEQKHFYYKAMHHNVLLLLSKYCLIKKNLKILDAGCGTGLLTKKLLKYGEVYGVDESLEALKFCKIRKIKNLKKASVTKLPFKNNTFDVVTCIDVLYHQKVEDDSKALSEFYRILKPSGILILKVPAHKYLGGTHDKLVHTKRRYDKHELNNKITNAGFKILLLSYGHIILFPALFFKKILEKFVDSKNSNVQMPSNILNTFVILISKLETKIMLSLGLPAGISIYAVATRTAG